MSKSRVLTFLFSSLLAGLMLSLSACQTQPSASTASAEPTPRTQSHHWMSLGQWFRLHGDLVDLAEHSQAEVLLIGDSITAGWPQEIWEEAFGPGAVANLGIGGDTTANLLWRLDNGGLGNLQPQGILLLIGTNNLSHNGESPQEVFLGVQAIIQRLQRAFPTTPILLQGLLPFDRSHQSPNRALVRETNRLLAQLDDGHRVVFQDHGSVFLNRNGEIRAELMADFLHPTALGYSLWAPQLIPTLRAWQRDRSD